MSELASQEAGTEELQNLQSRQNLVPLKNKIGGHI